MVSNKCFQVIPRQSNFWRLQKCFKKLNLKKQQQQEFAMMTDTQDKVSRHFRFIEQLICPNLNGQTHCLLLVRSQPS